MFSRDTCRDDYLGIDYKSVAIVAILSKILELCILKLIEILLVTDGNQFGIKRRHGAVLCIYCYKSVIKYYNLCNSPVFVHVFLMLLKLMIKLYMYL